MSMLSPAMERVSNALGLSVPIVQFLIGFLATLPMGWGWRLLPKEAPRARHWYAAMSGVVVSHYALPPGSNVLLVAPIAISYASMVLWRRRCGELTFILAFGFLLGCHVSFMSGESWKQGGIDATGALMVLTLKVISAAMNYQDGLLVESVDNLRPAQKKNRVFDLPSPIAYLGYCFNCGTHLAENVMLSGWVYKYGDYNLLMESVYNYLGPVHELKSYIDWTENKSIWSCEEDTPPYLAQALRLMARSLVCLAFYMALSPHFSNTHSIITDVDQSWSGLKTFWLLWMFGFTARWKFYFIWTISEASLILSGFGFSGWGIQEATPKQAHWDQARNVDIPRVEFSGSGAQIPLHWNIHVGFWLRHYVYEPLSGTGGMGLGGLFQLVTTQVVAAVWHGLYIGYILFFIHSALMIAGARVIYKWQLWLTSEVNTSPPHILCVWVLGSKWELQVPSSLGLRSMFKQALAWSIGFSYASSVLHYSWAGFLLLNLRDTLLAYDRMHYVGTIVPLLVILIGKVVKPPQPYALKGMEKTQ